ncbi:MAG: deoxyribose-phosphate aldolase [Elusimicrobiota bacterium]
MSNADLARMIDHTVLKADATEDDIAKLCEEAKKYGFFSVCVNPSNISAAKRFLHGSQVKVCTVIGFPLGATTTKAKVEETRDAVSLGVNEVDMVMNIGAMKSRKYAYVLEDIRAVKETAGELVLKVILETCYLTDDEKVYACKLAKEAGADFVKNSTGFGTSGVSEKDIKLMRKTVGEEMGVKASGGVKTREIAMIMVAAGATRIGTSSGVTIVSAD